MKIQGIEIKAQGIKISHLKDTVKNQQTEIERLNAIITNLQTANTEINVGAIQTDHDSMLFDNGSKPELHVQNLPQGDEGHPDEIEEDKPRDLFSVSRLLTTDVPVQPSAVAFYAQLTSREANVGKHHPIVFDHVTLNVGYGYNKHTGAFTAPVSGIYVFTFTLFLNRGSNMAVNIFKNSEVIAQVYTEMRTDTLSGTTPVAVVDMNVGDTAFVRTSSIHQPHGDVFSDVNVKTSFAGWKIADS
ncbi:collagen alpha-1(VIII) chain-like isoform X2 [Mytilus galloprovincialis]|uniref:collagen alpha-1(VIII) chain-like isoform X2 n=1 Tax=Mytilus galloprovincialis TaxID=29158 RepID=UPI003F7CCFAA